MTNEQREAIYRLRKLKEYNTTYYGSMYFKVEVKADEEMKETIDTVLSLIKEQQNTIGELKEKLILENKAKNKAEEECKRLWYTSSSTCYYDMQAEIKKKDKQIDLMADFMYKTGTGRRALSCVFRQNDECNENGCRYCIKQYFADLIEKEDREDE